MRIACTYGAPMSLRLRRLLCPLVGAPAGSIRATLGRATTQPLEHGNEQIGIGVAPDNAGARRLYERLGFTGSSPSSTATAL